MKNDFRLQGVIAWTFIATVMIVVAAVKLFWPTNDFPAYKAPKFIVGQELLITEGFYMSADIFLPFSFRVGVCRFGTKEVRTIIYTGSAHVESMGWIDDVHVCEENLRVKK